MLLNKILTVAGLADKLAMQLGPKLLNRIKEDDSVPKEIKDSDPKEQPKKMILHIRNHDPAGKYLPWLVHTYTRGGIRKAEDLSRAKNALTLFDKNKDKIEPEKKDINVHKELPDLEDTVEKFEPKKENLENLSKKDIKDHFINSGEASVIHDTDTHRIVVPHTKEASQHFGVNTKWCTAATDGENYFDSYNQKGKLLYVQHKKENKKNAIFIPKGTAGSVEAFDEKDRSINPKNYLNKNPDLKPSIENYLKDHPKLAFGYAASMKEPLSKEAEEGIGKDGIAANLYMKHFKKKIPIHPDAEKDPKYQLWKKLKAQVEKEDEPTTRGRGARRR